MYKIDARVCLTHASAAAGAAAAAAETPSVTAVRDQCNMGSARFRSQNVNNSHICFNISAVKQFCKTLTSSTTSSCHSVFAGVTLRVTLYHYDLVLVSSDWEQLRPQNSVLL